MENPLQRTTGQRAIPTEPVISEAQARVLRFLVTLSRQPSQRARASAAVLMAWNRDPDFDLVYPVIEAYWMGAMGYFERDKSFNPTLDQDRIIEHILNQLSKRFPEDG